MGLQSLDFDYPGEVKSVEAEREESLLIYGGEVILHHISQHSPC
jgi:hypothetical protein